MSGPAANQTSTDVFFSQRNEGMLQRVLYNDICRRTGNDMTEKQAARLIKTVKHYMGEVYRVQGQKPVPLLNKEVLQVVLPDYMQYMERQRRSSGRSVLSDIDAGPGLPAAAQQSVVAIEDVRIQRTSVNVSQAFDQLQASRQESRAPHPAPPDFAMSLQDEPPVSMDVFERIKRDREDEARRVAQAQQAQLATPLAGQLATPLAGQLATPLAGQQQARGQQAFAAAADTFARERRRAEEEAENAFAEQERRQLESRMAAASAPALPLAPPPDMRALFLGDRQNLERTAFAAGRDANANPTTAQPYAAREPSGGLQQMIVQKVPDVMTYKETELNLFVYSGDRDWTSPSSTETRYSFTVSFDPANTPTGLRLSPASTVKFKNITRIELVKVILPGENLEPLVTRNYVDSSIVYDSPFNINALSYPYIQIRVPELDNNVYGTNLGLNAAFGVLQYDANWISDTSNETARGYFAMIPKFLKCQKVYQPTPLSTLQKLTFRLERPDGTLLSTVPDTLDIEQIFSSKQIAADGNFPYGYDTTVEATTGASYYILRTKKYFDRLSVSKGDRIVIKGLTWADDATNETLKQLTELNTYLQSDSGLLVVDVGVVLEGMGISATLGPNSQGYCNMIVVRGRFSDPTTGDVTTVALGGQSDESNPSVPFERLTEFLAITPLTKGRLLNQSHQVQVAMRVIVRELDATGVLRPDNL